MAAAVERRGSGAVMQDLEPEKGVEARPRKEELFLVLVWEAGLAPFFSSLPRMSILRVLPVGPLHLPRCLTQDQDRTQTAQASSSPWILFAF